MRPTGNERDKDMNSAEGLRRIATTIRWVGDIAGGLCILVGVIAVLANIGDRQTLVLAAIFSPLGAAILSGTGRLVGWIILGFVEPSKSE